jgi:two-component system, OmpR family, phosphate regulon sensor histidine kinase PhoR
MIRNHQSLRKLINSIGTKIILPYVFLTMIVAGIGAFIVTNLVTGTLQERFDNQLLDAGRVVAEIMVDYEQTRLSVLRAVAGTEGVPEAVLKQDTAILETLVPQIIANSAMDAVILIDESGYEIYSWHKKQDNFAKGVDFSQLEEVQLVLDGYVDESGNRRVLLIETPQGYILFTVGPIFVDGEQVGAVLVGNDIANMVLTLTENAIARVTLYDANGNIVDTSLATGRESVSETLQETPEWYQQVATSSHKQVPTRSVNLLNQNYLLAFGDWRLRGQSFGMYSVALPSNFIVSAAATSRNSLSLVFSMATIGVIAIGYLVSQRIVLPLNHLVQTSAAVSQGNLSQRSGIKREDEIGVLAESFDNMTETLEIRNQQLMEQASNLNAILQSIADGVIVLDRNNQIVTTNLAAQQIITDFNSVTHDSNERDVNEFMGESAPENWLEKLTMNEQMQRYKLGNRFFSTLPAPVTTPEGHQLGTVIVMRDITREVEAEERQNSFITNVSHELRTPLTSVKGFISLMLSNGKDNLGEQNWQFAKIIDSNTDILISHVNRLLEITEIQSGTLKLNKAEVGFNQLVEETMEAWKPKMEGKDLLFSLDSTGEDLWISADAERLSWSIDNLLQNAYDFTPEGGQVNLRVFRQNGSVNLSVADTGIGINATDQPYVFDRFYRIDNEVTYSTSGMGLGLFILRFIIENHGGEVSLESQPQKGSTFSINIPIVENR